MHIVENGRVVISVLSIHWQLSHAFTVKDHALVTGGSTLEGHSRHG